MEVIKSIDFNKMDIDCFIIENNFNTTHVQNFLSNKGYKLWRKIHWDDVLIKISKD